MKPHHHPLVKRARRRLELFGRTWRWRPNHLRLAASGQVIYVDPRDERGWEIVRGLGRGHQPALMALWARTIEVLEPDLAIDVGANYGEMVLSARYGSGTAAYALEPNPTVAALLRRSVAAHPDADRIAVVEALASDAAGASQLFVDESWSGSASASRPSAAATVTEVDATTVDDVTAPGGERPKLALKVDAEGWEDRVLRGAGRLLGEASSTVAIIEFEPAHLRRAGVDPSGFFDRVQAIGACWAITHDGTASTVREAPTYSCDLVAVSDPGIATRLGLGTQG